MDTKELFLAKQQLNQFLSEHPYLKPLQNQIDALLQGAANGHNRRLLLSNMLEHKRRELLIEMHGLKLLLQNLKVLTERFK